MDQHPGCLEGYKNFSKIYGFFRKISTNPRDTLIAARCDKIKQNGGEPFRDYSIPDAVLKFRQGVGRLIRSKTDQGIIVVLDPRIVSKQYGKAFLNSIPPCPIEYF